jgi:multiple sugar transport system permease protein
MERARSVRRALRWFGKDPGFGLLLVVPLFVWVAATLLYPLIAAAVLSLKNVGYAGTVGSYVGLANYSRLLGSADFWHCVWLTVVWTGLNVGLQLGLALAGAIILNQDFFGQRFIRSWIIIPWVLPSIVLATLGKWILDPSLGVVNYLLRQGGLISTPISFPATPSYAMLTVTILNVWRWFPFFLITFLAALQTIPKEQYEAADIDRATAWQKFVHVDLPGIMPVMKVQAIMCTLWAANIFDTIWLLTRGGPGDATRTLTIQVYLKAFQEFRISQSSAMAMIMFVILLAGSLMYFRRALTLDWED